MEGRWTYPVPYPLFYTTYLRLIHIAENETWRDAAHTSLGSVGIELYSILNCVTY